MLRILAGLLFLFSGSLSFAQQENVTTLFLVGDAGEPYVKGKPIGEVLAGRIASAGGASIVLFLGDNVYPSGLPDKRAADYDLAESALRTQVSFLKGHPTRGIFIPGNHDWQHWGRRGLEYLRNQQAWLDSLHDDRIGMLPRHGCPGPVQVSLDENNLLVIIDTQWFLHQWDKPRDPDLCGPTTTAEVLVAVEDIFRANPDKRIILAAHHPLITYGEHGGVFTWKAHLFPLEEISEHLYIPMPLIGSIYPLYRKWFGHLQDTPHPVYREFADGLRRIMAGYPGSMYLAGHEHALQYIVRDSTHFVVSGSAAKTEWVKKKGYAVFAEDVIGFTQIDLHRDGKVSFQFIQADEQYPEGREVFSNTIDRIQFNPPRAAGNVNFRGQRITVSASDQYEAGNFKKRLFGKNYRSAWAQEVDVPLFDIATEKGGLKILQKGGGQQTLSLRLADSTGHEYVLRSVEKYPKGAIPEVLRETFAQDLVQDQISAAHPYAALVVAPMADALGLYHTNPRLVYIPDDPRLGQYRKEFANTLALFEERPDEDWSHAPWFGNSKNIISTRRVLEKLTEDNDNEIDRKFVLRNRLFDIVIGDWDRHDDQWRWATRKEGKNEIYQPIPRDRDQAFFVNEGMLARLWSRRWALPKFEGFDEETDWPSGLSFNARHFDRSFLTGLSRQEWVAVAEEIQKALTDSVIESAIRQWPDEIFQLHGEEIIRKLKARRSRIVSDALSHYEFLAREVDVVGSDKMELFDLTRLPSGDVRVLVQKISKKGKIEQTLYDRTFLKDETKEIRLYGLGGDDRFRISGDVDNAIRTRVIGGSGDDILHDSSTVRGPSRMTIFYDQTDDGQYTSRGEVRDLRSADPAVNQYDRMSFEYDRLAPLVWGQYNPDDRLFVGAGFLYLKRGFRKNPFAQRHLFLASFAPETNSYNFQYKGKFTKAVGPFDLEIDADIKSPNYVNNFFGFGNESIFNDEIDDVPGIGVDEAIQYYRYRFDELLFYPSLSGDVAGKANIQFGPVLQGVNMERPGADQDRFIETYAATLSNDLFEDTQWFGGLGWEISSGTGDVVPYPERGARISISGRNIASLHESGSNFSAYEGSLSIYHSFRQNSRLVLAGRAGGGFNTGNYPFFQSQILGGKTDLRGYRKTRFYGDSKFYANAEARLRLLNFRSYLFPASFGILGFFDVGRIWYKNELGVDPSTDDGESNLWHRGFGGGIWFTPFNFTVLSIEAGHSREETLGYVRLGFLF